MIGMALECPHPPSLEKVKAHDSHGLDMGHPKALGNDMADQHAKRAALEAGVPLWELDSSPYEDPVQILDSSGNVVLVVQQAFPVAFWQCSRAKRGRPRQWLDLLYDPQYPVLWDSSVGILKRPVVSGGKFVYPAQPAVIKWVSRIRAGCLATRLRLHNRQLIASPQCLCCHADVEDDAHVLFGCPGTGTSDWMALLHEAWLATANALKLMVPLPVDSWFALHTARLMAAVIPSSITSIVSLTPSDLSRFLSRLHFALAGMVAERLRRREVMMAEKRSRDADASSSANVGAIALPASLCPLPAERQLSISTLRTLEVGRRASGVPQLGLDS